jgi:rare lipoprotein A
MRWVLALLIWFAFALFMAVTFHGKARAESGIASVYAVPGRDVYAGRTMACGGKASPAALTAAHKTLPCGTRVRVTNRRNGQSAVVTIRDRGPFIRGRIIDLKPAGSRAIACGDLCPVTLTRM